MNKLPEKKETVQRLIALITDGIHNHCDQKVMRKLCYKLYCIYDDFEASNALPPLDDDLREYIEDGYRKYLIDRAHRTTKLTRVLRGIFVGIISTVVLAITLQIIAYTFGYDIFKEIADWGKQILLLPDGITEQGDITINKTSDKNGMRKFSTISEMIYTTGVSVLSPAYLPEDLGINYIMYLDQLEKTDIIYHIEDMAATLLISSDVQLPNSIEPVAIGGYECYISHVDLYQADFIAENADGEVWQYTILYTDYDELVKIIENLEYK